MSTLNEPTPVRNILTWQIGSFVYGLIILFNENAYLLSGLGLNQKTENWIKITGVLLYFLFTHFNFKKSTINHKEKN
jgi:hypothetical protein